MGLDMLINWVVRLRTISELLCPYSSDRLLRLILNKGNTRNKKRVPAPAETLKGINENYSYLATSTLTLVR